MENQYNYYTSDQKMNTEKFSTGVNQDQGPKKKHGKGASRWAKVVCTGLVFGVVASAAFQTSNIVAGKVLGTTQTTNNGNKQHCKKLNLLLLRVSLNLSLAKCCLSRLDTSMSLA